MRRESARAFLGDLEQMDKERQLRVEIDKELEQSVDELFSSLTAAIRNYKTSERIILNLPGKSMNARVVGGVISRLSLEDDIINENISKNIITELMQYVYGLGHNNFQVLTATTLENFGHRLIGEPGRPLELSITGDLGNDCFYSVKYVAVTVRGNVGESFGDGSKCSYFDIHGSIGAVDGWGIEGCTFRHKSQAVLDKIRKETRGNNNKYILKSGEEVSL